jgi:hypothetical protein
MASYFEEEVIQREVILPLEVEIGVSFIFVKIHIIPQTTDSKGIQGWQFGSLLTSPQSNSI